MNLLAKTTTLLLALSILFLPSCNDDPEELGLNIKPEGHAFGVFFTDSLQVQTSTVVLDSVNTFNSTYILAGQYNDPKLGKVSTKSFMQIGYSGSTDSVVNFPAGATLEKISLYLAHSGYTYGNSDEQEKVAVYRLQNSIALTSRYYSFQSIPYSASSIGTATYQATAGKTDTLEVPLTGTIGTDLLDLLKLNLSERVFQDRFFGLALASESSENSGVIGYSSGRSYIQLTYNDNGTSKTFNFSITRFFASVQDDRQGTAYALLQNGKDSISSTSTNAETVIQGGSSLMAKVTFPDLVTYFKDKGAIAINHAELIVEPVNSNDGLGLPPSLVLYNVDANNYVSRSQEQFLYNFSKADFNAPFPNIAIYNQTRKAYVFRIDNYITSRIAGKAENRGFFIGIPSYTINPTLVALGVREDQAQVVTPGLANEDIVNRLVIGNSQHPTNRIKLKIYYTPVKTN
jgi:hypothetical protein